MAKSLQNLSDSDFLDAVNTFISALQTGPLLYGTTSAEVTVLVGLRDTFQADLTNQIAVLAQGKASTAQKNHSRDLVEAKTASMRDKAKAIGVAESLMLATGLPSGGDVVPP